MKRLVLVAALLGVMTATAGPALSAEEPAHPRETAIGTVLANDRGRTLYTFDRDSATESQCNRQCSDRWPPLMAARDDAPHGDYTIVQRKDGSRQWAYKGRPLYSWSGDRKPGDTTGDGMRGIWHAARP